MGQKANSLILRVNQKIYEPNFKYIYNNFEESTVLLYKSIEINLYIRRLLKSFGLIIHTLKFEYFKQGINLIIFVVSKNLKLFEKFDMNDSEFNKHINSFYLILWLIKKSVLEVLNTYTKSNFVNIYVHNVYKKFLNYIIKSKSKLVSYQKILKIFRKFFKNSFLKEIFIASSISIFEKRSANYLANYLGKYFVHNKKRHNYLISFLKKLFPALISSSFSRATGVKIVIKGRINGAPRAKTITLQIGQIPLQSLALNIDYFNEVVYTFNGSFGIKVWICYK